MGTYKKGVNGPFSGKIGSVIGSKWKGVRYMKGIARKRSPSKPTSESELFVREKFTLLNKFFSVYKIWFEQGFRAYTARCTGLNAGVQHNYDTLQRDENGQWSFDFPRIQFSKGALYTAGAEKAYLVPGGIRVAWNSKTYGISGSADDVAYAIGLIAEGSESLRSDCNVDHALRHHGTCHIGLNVSPEEVKGGRAHVYLFFASRDGRQVSRTVYVPLVNDADEQSSS